MRKFSRGALVALVLVVGACGGGDDDSSDDGAGIDDSEAGSDSDSGSGGDRQDYVEAIAASVSQSDDAFTDLDDAEAECVGEAYVDAIGLEELEANVTPAEIRAEPDADHNDWGIEMTDDQGIEVYRALVDCAPGATRAVASGVAEGFTEGFTGEAGGDIDVDVDCLADADSSELEGFIGAAIAQGDDFAPDEEQGVAVLDWLKDCVDLRQAFVAAVGSDPTMPAGAADCLSNALDDQFIEDFWRLAFTSGSDESTLQDSPLMGELTSAMTGCAGTATTAAPG